MLGKKGFTLVELLIVIIIVGILAAVAVPMMRSNVERARKTEAVAALGAIRTAERLYFAQNNAYVSVPDFDDAAGHALEGFITGNDLDGQFFDSPCYSVEGDATTFTATCDSSASSANQAAAVADYSDVTINEEGTLTNS